MLVHNCIYRITLWVPFHKQGEKIDVLPNLLANSVFISKLLEGKMFQQNSQISPKMQILIIIS